MHWADVLARELCGRTSRHVLATAITPSGPIHVGNMREVLTTEFVHRSIEKLGAESELIYIGDTYDPLRKVYPFLDAAVYQEHVGKPLADIPCPGGCHESYAAHFLEPFLQDLEQLGIRPRVLLAHEMYREGMYLDATREALDQTDTLREIIERVSKRSLPKDWLPFNVQCASCMRVTGPIPTLYEYPNIEYNCTACGHEGVKDIREPGGGKLPWRVDWPARWKFLEVTFEAMGKDHAAAGSSWDTGVEIVEKVYHAPPPVRTVYEFIQLKGVGAMHSSTGTAVSASQMLRMTPPEVMRFLIARYQPNKHIDFDPGMGIVDLVNDYDRWEHAFFEHVHEKPSIEQELPDEAQFKELERVIELSQPNVLPTREPPRIPYNHIVLLTDLAGDWRGVKRILERSEMVESLSPEDEAQLAGRVEHARYWLEHFAPPEARTQLATEWRAELMEGLGTTERRFFDELAERLRAARWTAETLHNTIHEAAKQAGLGGGKAFQAIYSVFLGKKRGPRAGHFLASLEREFVLQRLREAASAGQQ